MMSMKHTVTCSLLYRRRSPCLGKYILLTCCSLDFFLILVQFRFGFWKKTLIRFGMILVRFRLKKMRFGSNIIVIYYWCNSWVVNLQQTLQRYCYVEWTVRTELCFGRVLKRSLSPHWMQVKLSLSLFIWIADCTQFLSENCLNGCQIFRRFGSFKKTECKPIFSFLHTPTYYR